MFLIQIPAKFCYDIGKIFQSLHNLTVLKHIFLCQF